MSSSSSSCGCATPETCEPAAISTESRFTAQAAEFVALGAAIGANCEPCLRYHVREAEKAGISKTDIAKAVAVAVQVKNTPAANILKLAQRLTEGGENEAGSAASSCGCST